MIDATQLPSEPCDPAKLESTKPEPEQQYARAPDGNGHEAALGSQGRPQ